MYRVLTSLLASGTCLFALSTGPAQAASPCFAQARDFGTTLSAMGDLKNKIDDPSQQLQQATDLRNQGMQACDAGRVADGRSMIERATAMLKG